MDGNMDILKCTYIHIWYIYPSICVYCKPLQKVVKVDKVDKTQSQSRFYSIFCS
jgi:hypothetical protein